jgi:hypothetical protein
VNIDPTEHLYAVLDEQMDLLTPNRQGGKLLPVLLPFDTLELIRDLNLPFLEPVETLNEICRQEMTEKRLKRISWKEYRLHGQPKSLKAFVDFFLLGNGEYDENRVLWITENAFVCLRTQQEILPGYLPEAYREEVFDVELEHGHGQPSTTLVVCSSTLQEAMPALDFLFGLRDHHFDLMSLLFRATGDERQARRCPLTDHLLEKMLVQNSRRMNQFCFMVFKPEQCRILATSGTRTSIELFNCNFEDDGAAFLEALAARDDRDAGPAKLSICGTLPCGGNMFVLCLHQLNLVYLELFRVVLESDHICRAVAEVEVHDLRLIDCGCKDEGAALVESVRAERGPKGLDLESRPLLNSPERFNEFVHALRGNAYLERLDLAHLDVGDGKLEALVDALPENVGLVQLDLRHCTVDDCNWNNLVRAISKHPSLRTLTFESIYDDDETWLLERRDRISALAVMLSENEQVEDIQVEETSDDDTYDHVVWDELIVPRLECNLYRKRFAPIQRIQNPKTRAAVMTRALAHVKSKPSLLYMLLSHNHDTVSSYLSEALRRNDS